MHLSELYKKSQKLDGLRQRLADAAKNNASDDIPGIFMEMCQTIGEINAEEYESQINGLRQQLDDSALYARGVRQLTTEESDYYLSPRLCRAQTPSRPSTTFPSSSLRPSFPV